MDLEPSTVMLWQALRDPPISRGLPGFHFRGPQKSRQPRDVDESARDDLNDITATISAPSFDSDALLDGWDHERFAVIAGQKRACGRIVEEPLGLGIHGEPRAKGGAGLLQIEAVARKVFAERLEPLRQEPVGFNLLADPAGRQSLA